MPLKKFNFDKVLENFKQVKKDLPKVLASETKVYFLDSFRKEGWDGKAWKVPQRRFKEGGSSRNNSATLVQSGALRRAVAGSLVKADFDGVKFSVSDVPYAAVHNDGLRAGRGVGFDMPQRKFMGDTESLRKKQREVIKQFIGKIWRS